MGDFQCDAFNWRVAERQMRGSEGANKKPSSTPQTPEADPVADRIAAIQLCAEEFIARLAQLAQSNRSTLAEQIDNMDPRVTRKCLAELGISFLSKKSGDLAKLVKTIITFDNELQKHKGAIAEHLRNVNISN